MIGEKRKTAYRESPQNPLQKYDHWCFCTASSTVYWSKESITMDGTRNSSKHHDILAPNLFASARRFRPGWRWTFQWYNDSKQTQKCLQGHKITILTIVMTILAAGFELKWWSKMKMKANNMCSAWRRVQDALQVPPSLLDVTTRRHSTVLLSRGCFLKCYLWENLPKIHTA